MTSQYPIRCPIRYPIEGLSDTPKRWATEQLQLQTQRQRHLQRNHNCNPNNRQQHQAPSAWKCADVILDTRVAVTALAGAVQ